MKKPYALTRRQFLTWGTAASVAVAAGGAAEIASLHHDSFFDQLAVTDYAVSSASWPQDYPELTIAFLTDLHVGCASVPLEKLNDIVKQVNALQADIILLGGDYLSQPEVKFIDYVEPEPIAAKLALLAAPLGVHSVLGNHDWYFNGEGMWRALEKNGITVMENSATFISFGPDGFWLVGLADYLTRWPDYTVAMQKAAGAQPKIVISHDPITYRHMPQTALLQLSGHTHGGQVRLPFLDPVSPTPGTPLNWIYGRVDERASPLIVSSGVGTSVLPIKNTPCEIVRVTIRAAAS